VGWVGKTRRTLNKAGWQFVLIAPAVLNFRIRKEIFYEDTGH